MGSDNKFNSVEAESGAGSVDRFEDLLNRDLERVLAGKASVEECTTSSSEFADDLKPLLGLALSGREALRVEAPVLSKEISRQKLMAHAESIRPQRRSRLARIVWRPLALTAGLFVLLSAGTAVAASGAAPDSILYPLRERLEDARTTLAMQNADRAQVEVGHANGSLDQLDQMVGENKSDYIARLLSDYDRHLNNAAGFAQAAAANGENTADIEALIQATRDRHDAMIKSLERTAPEEAARTLRDAEGDAAESDNAGGGAMQPSSGAGNQPAGNQGSGNEGEIENHDGGSGGSGGSGGYEQPDMGSHDNSQHNGDSQSGGNNSGDSGHSSDQSPEGPQSDNHKSEDSHSSMPQAEPSSMAPSGQRMGH